MRLVARTHVVQTPLHGGSVRPSSTVQVLGMHEDSLEVVDTTVQCRVGSCAAIPGGIPCNAGWEIVLCRMPCGIPRRS